MLHEYRYPTVLPVPRRQSSVTAPSAPSATAPAAQPSQRELVEASLLRRPARS